MALEIRKQIFQNSAEAKKESDFKPIDLNGMRFDKSAEIINKTEEQYEKENVQKFYQQNL